MDNYRGFQTMDSKDHPVVLQGIKAAQVTSTVSWLDRDYLAFFLLMHDVSVFLSYELHALFASLSLD